MITSWFFLFFSFCNKKKRKRERKRERKRKKEKRGKEKEKEKRKKGKNVEKILLSPEFVATSRRRNDVTWYPRMSQSDPKRRRKCQEIVRQDGGRACRPGKTQGRSWAGSTSGLALAWGDLKSFENLLCWRSCFSSWFLFFSFFFFFISWFSFYFLLKEKKWPRQESQVKWFTKKEVLLSGREKSGTMWTRHLIWSSLTARNFPVFFRGTTWIIERLAWRFWSKTNSWTIAHLISLDSTSSTTSP